MAHTISTTQEQTRKAAQRRARMTRALIYILAVAMACWILLPIWLIVSAGVYGPRGVL